MTLKPETLGERVIMIKRHVEGGVEGWVVEEEARRKQE